MTRLFAHHHRPDLRLEPNDQTDLFLHTAHGVPRHEEAVGMAHLRFTVVGLYLIGGEDVFARRTRIGRLAAVLVEGVNDQFAVDLDRFILVLLIEHQAAAEPASRCFSLSVADRVDPNGNDAIRDLGFVLIVSEKRGR